MSSSSSSSNDSTTTTSIDEWLLTTMWRTCPIDFILKDEVLEIILKRGSMDGKYVRASLESALSSEGSPYELVLAATLMNTTNSALISSNGAIEAASLAINLAMATITTADHNRSYTISDETLEFGLASLEESIKAAKISQIVLQNSRRSSGSHDLHD